MSIDIRRLRLEPLVVTNLYRVFDSSCKELVSKAVVVILRSSFKVIALSSSFKVVELRHSCGILTVVIDEYEWSRVKDKYW